MSVQFSVLVKNGMLDAFESVVGEEAILKIRSSDLPANCEAENAGEALVTFKLPADWMKDAAEGKKVKVDAWAQVAADVAGEAKHWRLYNKDESACHAQGTVSASGAGGDMELDNVNIAVGQKVSVSNFSMGI